LYTPGVLGATYAVFLIILQLLINIYIYKILLLFDSNFTSSALTAKRDTMN